VVRGNPEAQLPRSQRWRNWLRRRVRAWFRRQAPKVADEQPDMLTWQQRLVVRLVARLPAHRVPPRLLRRAYRLTTVPFHVDARPVGAIADLRLAGGVGVRVYEAPGRGGAPGPALVYFHGGGFVIGDLETHDVICRHVVCETGLTVVAADYRRAPRYRFPVAVEDAIVAYNWTCAAAGSLGIDPGRVGVGGDSAGGYLAAVVSQQAVYPTLASVPDRVPAFQWLIYPAVDQRFDPAGHRFPDGVILTDALVAYFRGLFLDERKPALSPPISPMGAQTLAGLPPAMLLTVGHDPLCEQGSAYARRLAADGVALRHRHFPRLMHEFISLGGVCPESRRALDVAAADLRELASATAYT
jgi:acetyl esterase